MAKFVPRERKHKKVARQKDAASSNTNHQAIIPESQSEKEARRIKLHQELRDEQAQSKIPSKKRKRLDKYIDTKLRKDENAELVKKLSAQKVDTSLLRSSKKLGRVNESKREKLSRVLRERQRGLDVDGKAEEVLLDARPGVEGAEGDESENDQSQDEDDGVVVVQALRNNSVVSTFGGGLKRPLEMDENGQPVMRKRKRRRKEPVQIHDADEDEDETPISMNGNSSDEDTNDGDEDEWDGSDSDVGPSDNMSEASNSSDEQESDPTSASEDDDDPEEESRGEKPAHISAFKAWADSHRNAAVGFAPSSTNFTNDDAAVKASFKPRAPSPDPLLSTVGEQNGATSATASFRPAAALTIPRSEEIQAARLELPVVQEEQKIMEAIHNNPVVVVCGATGSGKTTQVPQMLFENGYGSLISGASAGTTPAPQSKGMIGITQPRRVAATSVAERVAYELGSYYRHRAAHQVRYDSNVSLNTAIKFMTDGILLREIQQDFPLSKYSVIVIDEAHERSVNTDILIGMLSRIVTLRAELAVEQPSKFYPLKLVIMSATLRTNDFLQNARLFRDGVPPVVEVEGRQYPVTTHFSQRTHRDYVVEMVDKVARGHKKLPAGGMLVFLTGQQEIRTVMKSLKERLGGALVGVHGHGRHDFDEAHRRNESASYLEDDGTRTEDDSGAEITGLDGETPDEEFAVPGDQSGPRGALRPHILPLYAALPSAQQFKVFQPPPDGSRLVVLATNVAETSLTIPGIRYVFDSGRSKEKKYDSATGVQTLEVDWISKASALQRTGRAGRTGPGHCWRLYSSTVYEQYFEEHTEPEILRTPLESTVLQLKAMEIEHVANFPFPTAPEGIDLEKAARLLKNLGAIDEKSGTITDTGRGLIRYPLSPRFGKMLMLAQKNGVVAHAIAIVAGLAVGDLSVPEAQPPARSWEEEVSEDDEDKSSEERRLKALAENAAKTAAERRHQAYTRVQAALSRWDDRSDAIKLLTAIAAHAEERTKQDSASNFCAEHFLREKGMAEVQQLRQQLHSILSSTSQQQIYPGEEGVAFKALLPLPTEKERTMLNQIVAAGFIDQVAIRSDLLKDVDTTAAFGRKPRRAIEVPYRTLFPSAEAIDRTASVAEQEIQSSVFLHPYSVLARLSVKEMPQYIIYSHLSRAAQSTVGAAQQKKVRMHPLTAIGPKALAVLAEGTSLLELGKPIGKIEDVGMSRRQCWVGLSLRALAKSSGGGGATGWPLGAWKVVQKRGKRDWQVEKVVAR